MTGFSDSGLRNGPLVWNTGEAENPYEALEFRSKGPRNYGIDGATVHNPVKPETSG